MALGEIAAGIQGVGAIGGLLGGKRSNRQADKSQAAARDMLSLQRAAQMLGPQDESARSALSVANAHESEKESRPALPDKGTLNHEQH
jgi:type II secretory pathway pseudopilin PulG